MPLITLREWSVIALIFAFYLGIHWFAVTYMREPILLFIPTAVAICVLYFNGIRLWPAIYVASLLSGVFILSMPLPHLFVLPIAEVFKVALGAFFLREAQVDPLFRKFSDMFFLILVIFVISTITPTISALLSLLTNQTFTIDLWGRRYAAAVLTLLLLVPLILRWFAKRRFNRTILEIAEIFAVFALLIVLSVFNFVYDIDAVAGIPLVYFILIPLFWIALRLRPRFVTLALIVLSAIALGSILLADIDPLLRSVELFQMEAFLITLSILFLLIVSLEEDRRLNVNLMRSQLSTLENAVSRISSESKAKNDFIAVLAHELRNPLAPIMSGIDYLKLTAERTKDEEETLGVMEDRMQTVKRLLDDLLDISRITENKLTLRKETLDLTAILRRAIISTEHHLRERHQPFTFKDDKEKHIVLGDPVRLEQIFTNLITNASKYSDPGDPISVTVGKVDDHVEVLVTDQGVGIRPEVLEAIFTPFHQVEQGERSIKGLGIGLALVKSFVEMHGGRVYAESQGLGRGSRFIVQIPLAQVTVDPITGEETTAILPLERDTTKTKVLVVDDNDAAAWSIGKLLDLQGCIVAYAYDSGQTIEKVKIFRPDVVLLDLGLPDEDGYATARILRTQGYTGRLIALTGYSTQDAKDRGKLAGFDDYLVKPVGVTELRRAISGLT